MRTDLLISLVASTPLVLSLTAAFGCATKGDEVAGIESGDETDGSGDGGDDATSDDGDGDGDGDADCEPGDSSVTFSYEPFDFGLPAVEDMDIEWTCTIADLDTDDGLYLELDCPEAPNPVFIDISANPSLSPPLSGEETIELRYVYDGPWASNHHLRLDLENGQHLLTLIDGYSLLPFYQKPFELPFAIETASGFCSPVPQPTFGCAELERVALEFEYSGEPVRVFDGSYTLLGGQPGTKVWVVEAEHMHDISCTDWQDARFRVLIVNENLSPGS